MFQKIKQISQQNFRDSFSHYEISSPNFHLYTGLVSSGASLTSCREGASLALVEHPSSDGVTIKMPYEVDVLSRPTLHPICSYWIV